LADCTRTSIARATAAIAVALLCCAALVPAAARADGDPASDILALQPLFVPQDAGVAAARRVQLGKLLVAARRAGYPVRVALISGPSDLGSIGELWRQPQTYARFLAQELRYVYRGPLLIVMPNGYGTANARGGAVSGAPGADLGAGAADGVVRLAASAGHRIATPALSEPAQHHGSTDVTAWIVFVAGGLAIAAAWTASVRRRPLHLGRRQVK
jgi:hypothetical protein